MLHYITKNKEHGVVGCNTLEDSIENGLQFFNNDRGFPVCVTYENKIEIDRQKFISIINKQSKNFDNIYHYEIDALTMSYALS